MASRNKRIDYTRLPKHIAFIMDGNGRWATKHGFARNYGHNVGAQSLMKVVRRCAEIGIKVISFYAFSTENWQRPEEEVGGIMDAARKLIEKHAEQLIKDGVKIVTMGDTTKFPQDMQDKLKKLKDATKNNTLITLNMAINYGGRAEIIRAAKTLKNFTEEEFSKMISDLPDPDMVVRTSGEQRVSNFMLWQIAYSELYFPKIFWPAVNEKFVDKCVIEFQKRKRRFGKL